ncbi:MAG: hypothetical protein ACOX07_00690 [Methanobacterium sp.]|jgi:hypothetical protein|uniref:hypothetical protein n=1 Tax=Methanobacterium sp. TaxID=2164 RepID=UPI002805049C|nr:hypothetical protein [uncultured Methanobacterium sp.]
MDNKGYVMNIFSFLLVLPVFILLIGMIDVMGQENEIQQSTLNSHEIQVVSQDVEANSITIGREVLRDASLNVVNSGYPLSNSREKIKDEFQQKMDLFCSRYSANGMDVTCEILGVNNSEDPFNVEFKSIITVEKGTTKQKLNISHNISLTNGSYPLCDPLPFIKCKNNGHMAIEGERICYGSSLAQYLNSRGIRNFEAYENATSPLFIKKCPYDPYNLHGNRNDKVNLKNCIDNGFYHVSNDGACFLCRLEGKGVCPHYGMETFIIPPPSPNISNNSSTAPSSVDHVIFNDTGDGTYSGQELLYFFDGKSYFKLYLDNAHESKYGLLV